MRIPEVFSVLVVTLSDRASRGEYTDLSGPKAKELLGVFFDSVKWEFSIDLRIIADDASLLKEILLDAAEKYNIVITTGGTGIGPRDFTVDTVKPMLSKEIPGIMEYIRIKYGAEKPNALLSRAVAGLIGKTLVYTLPGSPRAVEEYLSEILKTLVHTVNMQYGVDRH